MRPRGPRCNHPGCEIRRFGHGYCRYHYYRHKHGLPMDAPKRGYKTRNEPPKTCTVDGCGRIHQARGFCAAHYMQAKQHRAISRIRDGYTQWSEEDDNILRWYIGMEPITAIARRLQRGVSAVERRAGILNLNFRREAERQAGYNLVQAAAILGVVPQSVGNWVRKGWLRAEYPWSAYIQRPSISEDAIIEFLRERGALMTAIRPTDRVIAAIVDEARADLMRRYISRKHLADILCYSVRTMSSLIAIYQMPPPAIDCGNKYGGHWYDRAKISAWLDTCPERWTPAARRELQAIDRPHAQ